MISQKARKFFSIVLLLIFIAGNVVAQPLQQLKIAPGSRYFMQKNGQPFFWMGDTGWLLFGKLDREEAEKYLEIRRQQGFNVIQVMVLHTLEARNVYGQKALLNRDIATPRITKGNSPADTAQYDYWDHVDFIIKKAEEKGLYMALVPVWGTAAKSGPITPGQAKTYGAFLAKRYKGYSNIIWLNGGDIKGDELIDSWNALGSTLRSKDKKHLITFHPRGRATSSIWFHQEKWLDFNMFQSGHRRYDQDTSANEQLHFGEDNWRYVAMDYAKTPLKPTLDGEPSYEEIPIGLHDSTQGYWTDNDVRRYGYWGVLSGGAGYTYGHNSVMQMFKPGEGKGAFGAKSFWYDAILYPGARQMVFLKNLVLSHPYFERVPDQGLIANQGEKYDYLVAARGKKYAFIYTYNGRPIKLNMGKIDGSKVRAFWYSPRNGESTPIGLFENEGTLDFDPPGEKKDGNDWVLVLNGE